MSRHIVYRDKSLLCIVGYDKDQDAFTFELRKDAVRSKSWYRASDAFNIEKCFEHVKAVGSVSRGVELSVSVILHNEASDREDNSRTYSWDKDIPFEEKNFPEW